MFAVFPHVDQTFLSHSNRRFSHVDQVFLSPFDRTTAERSEIESHTIDSNTTKLLKAKANPYHESSSRCRIFRRQAKWRSKLSHPQPPLQPLSLHLSSSYQQQKRTRDRKSVHWFSTPVFTIVEDIGTRRCRLCPWLNNGRRNNSKSGARNVVK